jgi:hypothetical protein
MSQVKGNFVSVVFEVGFKEELGHDPPIVEDL